MSGATSPAPRAASWKEALAGRMPPALEEEIDLFEDQIALRKQGKIDEKVFAETRLRRGVYGQRYDHGERHDGEKNQKIPYPSGDLTKGPNTCWDAPGMQRIKIPFGGLSPEQLEVLAEVAEEYSDGILHVTTRQDVQLHFVHIDDTPDLMRRLAAVGITTREACGNTVRNVTACPIAGVCPDMAFDVTPYAKAAAYFLLGHRDTQDFGRKFKIAFSGCAEAACGLASIHDIGVVARTREKDGTVERGFSVYVGGGLGPVPFQAKLFDDFVPEEELLPLCQAICRVFARLGEKKNRHRARMKFLVQKLGIEEFKRIVLEERKNMPKDDDWVPYFEEARAYREEVPDPRDAKAWEGPEPTSEELTGYEGWRDSNVLPQAQDGFSVAQVTLPLGDFTADQARRLADVARRFVAGGAGVGSIRTTVEQNLVLRWVPTPLLPRLYAALRRIGLAEAGASTIVDVTACPGTDTCKLGVASSRGLAAVLRRRLAARNAASDDAVKGLRIKISGCPNSCGQHHISDLGFYGASRNVGGYAVPHFQVIVGGQWTENAGSYGLAIGAVPSKRIPEVVDRLLERYRSERKNGERFRDFVARIGKAEVKKIFSDLVTVPPHEEDASFYSDWGDPREFTLGDIGKGECAGEVVSLTDFDLSVAESRAFEAQEALDAGENERAIDLAYEAMKTAARGLVKRWNPDVPNDEAEILAEFRARLLGAGHFKPFYAAHYLNAATARGVAGADAKDAGEHLRPDLAHQRVEEAQLFIEESHAAYGRLLATQTTA